jgi:DUF1680 family protein
LYRLARYLLLFAAIPLLADPPKPLSDVVPDAFTPVPHDQQRLAGLFAIRLRANTEGFLEHISNKELLAEPGSAGLFLTAAANSYEYTGDAQLKSVMERVARALIAQRSSESNNNLTDPQADANVLAGLLTYSDQTGDDEAFAGARRLGDLIVSSGAKPGVAGRGFLLQPMLDLYRETGDKRYVDFCDRVAHATTASGGNMLEALESSRGLLDYYRHTGDESFLRTVTGRWQSERGSLTGAPGASKTSTPCQTVSWFQLTLDLFRLTGQLQYADALERTIYNGLLAGQEPATGRIYESIPMQGSKEFARQPSACTVAEAVGLSQIPDAVWGRLGRDIVVLTYSPGHATVRLRRRSSVQIYTEGNYPETGDVLIHVEPNRETRFALRLRVPQWCDKFAVAVGGTRVTGKPGNFVTLSREWRKGDTVRLTMQIPTITRQDSSKPDLVALQRGPQILVFESKLNPDVANWASLTLRSDSTASVAPTARNAKMPFSAIAERAFEMPASYNGKEQNILLLPFADATSYRLWIASASAGSVNP